MASLTVVDTEETGKTRRLRAKVAQSPIPSPLTSLSLLPPSPLSLVLFCFVSLLSLDILFYPFFTTCELGETSHIDPLQAFTILSEKKGDFLYLMQSKMILFHCKLYFNYGFNETMLPSFRQSLETN